MAQFYNFGDGREGSYVSATCTGSSGSTTLTTTLGASVINGDQIFIHQTQHDSNHGKWELGYVASSTSTSITLVHQLTNSYTTGAQCVRMPQYKTLTSNLSAEQWNHSSVKGGILAFLCNGTVDLSSGVTISANNTGFLGGTSIGVAESGNGKKGETYRAGGGSYDQTGNNRNYGGGGGTDADDWAGGGGAARDAGGDSDNASQGGTAYFNANLQTAIHLGSGGGSGGSKSDSHSGGGGDGGGIVAIFAKKIIVGVGAITADGQNGGGAGQGGGDGAGGSGGGGGGAIYIVCEELQAGTDKITVNGRNGSTGVGTGSSNTGGSGGDGSIQIATCKMTGSISSNDYGNLSQTIGGYAWCGAVASIIH